MTSSKGRSGDSRVLTRNRASINRDFFRFYASTITVLRNEKSITNRMKGKLFSLWTSEKLKRESVRKKKKKY